MMKSKWSGGSVLIESKRSRSGIWSGSGRQLKRGTTIGWENGGSAKNRCDDDAVSSGEAGDDRGDDDDDDDTDGDADRDGG